MEGPVYVFWGLIRKRSGRIMCSVVYPKENVPQRETNHRTQSRRGQFLVFSLFLKKAKYLGSVNGIYRLQVVIGNSLDTVKDTVKEIRLHESFMSFFSWRAILDILKERHYPTSKRSKRFPNIQKMMKLLSQSNRNIHIITI